MLKVAICDDEKPVRERIEKLVGQCVRASVDLFASGEELLAAEKEYDILLLDICLKTGEEPGKAAGARPAREAAAEEEAAGPAASGMDIARKIRRKSNTLIIFITALQDYVYEGYDVEAFHYLLKPLDEEKLCRVVRRAAAKVQERRKARPLSVKVNGVYRQIPMEDIFYAENDARKIILHTRTGNLSYYEKMENLERKLGPDFFRTHRGFLVRLSEVASYDRSSITLKCGDTVFLSKQKYNGFVTAYMDFLTRF